MLITVVVGLLAAVTRPAASQPAAEPAAVPADVRIVPVAPGTSRNTINVAVFRKQSILSHGDAQFISFYDADGHVVLARRTLGSTDWDLRRTDLTGNIRDAHNAINIGLDGDGILHVAWDHHGNPLNYRRGAAPGSLELVGATMTGQVERQVTYPEFHRLPDGDLLFLYRDGASGRGNLAVNRYDVQTRTWSHLHSKLIDGQNQRNAYWQAATDANGRIHLSWVWRESGDVATNHDLCYARSADGGRTWTNSAGQPYQLPITAKTAEYAVRIPQRHELINQTSMTADAQGRPYIATYWRPEGTDVPQYFVVYHDGTAWRTSQVGKMTTPFRLGGGGSKRLPLSRPQILVDEREGRLRAHVVFRAEERGNVASLATCEHLAEGEWSVRDLTLSSLGMWEPTYDPQLWQRERALHLFVQRAEQIDAEGLGNMPPQMVGVLECRP